MKRSFIVSILLFSLMLTGCAKGSKPLPKHNYEESATFTESSLVYTSANEANFDVSQLYKNKYEHLELNDNLRINPITGIDSISLRMSSDDQIKDVKAYIECLSGKVIDFDDLVVSRDYAGQFYSLNPQSGFPYFLIYESGTTVWFDNNYAQNCFFEDEISERVFVSNDYEDKVYKLKDCNMKLSKAIEIAQAYSDKLNEYGLPKLIPYEVRIKKIGNNCAFDIEMSQSVDGIPIRSAYNTFSGDTGNDTHFSGKLSNYNNNYDDTAKIYGYSIIICTSSGVECFRNNENILYLNARETIDKIIDIQSSLKYIDENLSEESYYKVEYIGLEYKVYELDSDGVYPLQPMWTISLYSPKEDKYYYALVDCETGDFSFYGQ